jgi:hypothetical protein
MLDQLLNSTYEEKVLNELSTFITRNFSYQTANGENLNSPKFDSPRINFISKFDEHKTYQVNQYFAENIRRGCHFGIYSKTGVVTLFELPEGIEVSLSLSNRDNLSYSIPKNLLH